MEKKDKRIKFKKKQTINFIYILIGFAISLFSSAEAHGRRTSNCIDLQRAQDGKHRSMGYLEDGEDGEINTWGGK